MRTARWREMPPFARNAEMRAPHTLRGDRFDYPLMAVPEAGPKESLHYYLYKHIAALPQCNATRSQRYCSSVGTLHMSSL
jgi:hypothetical protein